MFNHQKNNAMTLIRREQNHPVWSNAWNDFFNHDWFDWTHQNYSRDNTTLPSVNVKEDEKNFEVEMAAPGLKKEDFKITLNNSLLTIQSEKKETKESSKDECYTRREFSYQSFSRSFTLPASVENDKIEARYDNGILKVIIPKKEEPKPLSSRQISIS